MPGNVMLSAARTGLSKDSVANVSQIVAIDRDLLTEKVGQVARPLLELVLNGIEIVLGR
jgi:mRNA interferase MazF